MIINNDSETNEYIDAVNSISTDNPLNVTDTTIDITTTSTTNTTTSTN